eukprot:TRINITY_DN604_c1_g1_i2.p1 TRINITY_DN604_c1_g1~~TRINITY_DN604_c1_g1_i2.p1  ORF type:complete len:823 (-),score=133.07 TRINITY_DN604_c1_g1_i2:195-2642(-)
MASFLVPTSKQAAKRPGDSQQGAKSPAVKAKAGKPTSGITAWGSVARAADRHHAKASGASGASISVATSAAKAKAGKWVWMPDAKGSAAKSLSEADEPAENEPPWKPSPSKAPIKVSISSSQKGNATRRAGSDSSTAGLDRALELQQRRASSVDGSASESGLQRASSLDSNDFSAMSAAVKTHKSVAPKQVKAPREMISPDYEERDPYRLKHGVRAWASDDSVEVPPPWANFKDAGIPAELLRTFRAAGFSAPTPIQAQVWPVAHKRMDVIGIARTGSGKTLGFLYPAYQLMTSKPARSTAFRVLILAPTRELATQIHDEATKYEAASGFASACVYGGVPKKEQMPALQSGASILVATPGRLNDFLEYRQVDLRSIGYLVFDEADRMLDMGFEPQIRKILAEIPSSRQTLFFTATWPQKVKNLANEFLRGAWTVTIGNRDELKGNQDISQTLRTCAGRDKPGLLMSILREGGVADRSNAAAKGLVFCATKRQCDQLAQQLERSGIPCGAVHGDKNQRDREAALSALKEGRSKLLVCTDVAARGLDIKGMTLVVQYDPPGQIEDYVHRIGRTGRAGMKGDAVTIICERDTHALRNIITVMKRTNQKVTPEIDALARDAPRPPPPTRGPPVVTIDPNFKPGLSTGPLGQPPEAPVDGPVAELPRSAGGDGGGSGGGKGGKDRDFGSSFDMGGGGDGGKGGKGGKGGGRAGDWNCPKCGSLVFASKSSCFKCGTTKDADGGSDGGPPPRQSSPSRRRRSLSRRRRSPSRRRRSPSRRRRSPSRKRGRQSSDDSADNRRKRRRDDKRRRQRSPSRDSRG